MQSQTSSSETWQHKVREFFWPLLEQDEPVSADHPNDDQSPPVITDEPVFLIEEENLDKAFELISKFADSEEDRRKGIESKATLFLSTISIATTLIVAANTILNGNTEKSWPVIASVAISFLLTVYASRTVWFSVKALERGNYSVLGFSDLNEGGDKAAYKKHLILKIQSIAGSNYKTINDKVSFVTMAQEYYKRAIVIICLYAFLIFLFCLFYKPVSKGTPAPAAPVNITTVK